MSRFAVIDFETTGFHPDSGDRAIEIGIVLVEGGAITKNFATLMNPGIRVPSRITQLTGITNGMVSRAPPAREAMREAVLFADGATPVAHNASFDCRFWNAELGLSGSTLGKDWLCTKLLSRRLYPWAMSYRLDMLCAIHRIPLEGRGHRALADAMSTAHLLREILKDLNEIYKDEIVGPEFLARYQRTQRARVRAVPQPSPISAGPSGQRHQDPVDIDGAMEDVKGGRNVRVRPKFEEGFSLITHPKMDPPRFRREADGRRSVDPHRTRREANSNKSSEGGCLWIARAFTWGAIAVVVLTVVSAFIG